LAHMIRPKAVLVLGAWWQSVWSAMKRIWPFTKSVKFCQSRVLSWWAVPEAIQNYTVYAVAVSGQTSHAEVAKSFVAMLGHQDAADVMRAKGMLPLP